MQAGKRIHFWSSKVDIYKFKFEGCIMNFSRKGSNNNDQKYMARKVYK